MVSYGDAIDFRPLDLPSGRIIGSLARATPSTDSPTYPLGCGPRPYIWGQSKKSLRPNTEFDR